MMTQQEKTILWKILFIALAVLIIVYFVNQYFFPKSNEISKLTKELVLINTKLDSSLAEQKKANVESKAAEQKSDSMLKLYLNQKPTNYKSQYEKDISTYRSNSLSDNQIVVSAWLHRK